MTRTMCGHSGAIMAKKHVRFITDTTTFFLFKSTASSFVKMVIYNIFMEG